MSVLGKYLSGLSALSTKVDHPDKNFPETNTKLLGPCVNYVLKSCITFETWWWWTRWKSWQQYRRV